MNQGKNIFRFTLCLFTLFLLMCSFVFISEPAKAKAKAKNAKLNIKKLDMTINSNFTLRVYNMKKKQKASYVSQDDDVAAVASQYSSGKRAVIHAQGIGTTTIQITIQKKKKIIRRLKCRIRVSPSGVSIKFLKRTMELESGKQAKVEPIIKPNTSTELPVYEVEDDSVASINSQGIVTALKPGVTQITATLLSTGQKAQCTIIVWNDSIPKPTDKDYKKSSIHTMEDF